MDSGDNVEKLFLETKRLRGSISSLKTFLTVGILLFVIVFFLLMWNLFGSYDKEKLGDALRDEMRIVTPMLSESAVGIAREALPVYQEAFTKEFQSLLPEVGEDIREEGLIFLNHVRENTPHLIQVEMELVLERVRKKIVRDFPELVEDEDKVVTALTNIAVCMQEEAEEIIITGIFSHQGDLLREIYETVHVDLKMRRSNESADQLASRLFGLLARIIEYEFFVDRVEHGQAAIIEAPVREKKELPETEKAAKGKKKPSRFRKRRSKR